MVTVVSAMVRCGSRVSVLLALLIASPHLTFSAEFSASCLGETACSAHFSDPGAKAIQSLYSAVAAADCELASPTSYPAHYSPVDGEEFDFIIVGAGSAGAVVANRLTEVSGWRVLLLEAGGNPTKTSEVPALFPFLQNTDLDWQYRTEPTTEYCLGMVGNRCFWPRGKVLGGSSTINYMIYVRGNAKDYDQWAADGNTGWGYNDVLPYFKKSEDMRSEEVLATPEVSKYHGTGGYLKVESWESEEVKTLSCGAFTEGMKELGYDYNADYNGKNQTGFVNVQGTLKDGRRCSTAKAFLTPITMRENLKVSKESLVTKILIDDNEKTANGVEFMTKDGSVVKVKAKKEVVVSAGAINSPQLLMLSGIGPRKHLEELNITVVQDLPVGENLQDHLLMNSLAITVNYSKPYELPETTMADFLFKKRSRYTSHGLGSFVGFINTLIGIDYPDIQLFLFDFSKNDTTALSKILSLFGFRDEIINNYLEINNYGYTIVTSGSLLRPYSRGRIQLKSTNPKDHPKITAGYFSDQRDIETFLRTYDVVSRLVETKGLKSVDAKLHEIRVPGCSKFPFASKDYRECSLRHLASSTYHYCSTCKMGPASSPESVVDPLLRVKGINKLRVVDASVMPSEVSGNINAAVIMIGEKGSDLIKEAWLSGGQR